MMCCPVVLVAALVIFSAAFISADQMCKVQRFGKMIPFWTDGVGTNIELPCKYRMAKFTAGGFRVKVSVTSDLDPGYQHRFSPSMAAIKVLSLNSRMKWTAHISCESIEATSGTVDAWNIGRSDFTPSVVTVNNDGVAVVQQDGVFNIAFSCPVPGSDDDATGVVVTVFGDDMTSSPYPRYMCGDGQPMSFSDRRDLLFGQFSSDASRSDVLIYDILRPVRRHGRSCRKLGKKFRKCNVKDTALLTCSRIFATRPLSKCLMDPANPQENFLNCLKFVCDSNLLACDALNSKILTSSNNVCNTVDPFVCSH